MNRALQRLSAVAAARLTEKYLLKSQTKKLAFLAISSSAVVKNIPEPKSKPYYDDAAQEEYLDNEDDEMSR